MRLHKELIQELKVIPGNPAGLVGRSTSVTTTRWLEGPDGPSSKHLAEEDLRTFRSELDSMQQLLYASSSHALLVVIQALDAAGKDSTIKHVMSGVNPQGCEVTAFKVPTDEEASHDFLWRCARALPARGRIGIFNRSYYEEVLVPRVHRDVLTSERPTTDEKVGEDLWGQRFGDITAFEQYLHRNGTRIVKLYLHVSKAEQKKRFLERIDDPSKNWKFSASDLSERTYFDDYLAAYESAITATSTDWAPWYVVPADHKYVLCALVGGILAHSVAALDLQMPRIDDEKKEMLRAAREALLAE